MADPITRTATAGWPPPAAAVTPSAGVGSATARAVHARARAATRSESVRTPRPCLIRSRGESVGGDAEGPEQSRQPRLRDRHARRHPSREPQELEKVEPAVEARGDGHRVAIDDDAHRLALLAEQKELCLVDALRRGAGRRDVDDRDAGRNAQ